MLDRISETNTANSKFIIIWNSTIPNPKWSPFCHLCSWPLFLRLERLLPKHWCVYRQHWVTIPPQGSELCLDLHQSIRVHASTPETIWAYSVLISWKSAIKIKIKTYWYWNTETENKRIVLKNTGKMNASVIWSEQEIIPITVVFCNGLYWGPWGI